MRGRVALLAVLLLTFCQFGSALAQRTWPTDAAGRPAPPCVIFDPVTSTSTFCSQATPVPTTPANTGLSFNSDTTGFGQAWFSAVTNFPELPVTQSVYPALIYVDDKTITGVRGEADNQTTVWTSLDGGYSYTRSPTLSATYNLTGFRGLRPLGVTRASNGNYVIAFPSVFTAGDINRDPVARSAFGGLAGGWVHSTGTMSVKTATAMSRASGNTVLVALTGSPAQICRTPDGGVSWACTTPPGNTGFTTINSLAPTTNVWLAQDASGQMFRSVDDGQSFTLAATLAQTGTPTAGGHPVSCLSATVCVAASGTAFYRSTDAGLTWTGVFNPGVVTAGDANQKALVVFNSTTVASIGNAGPNAWYRSSDAGLTWVEETRHPVLSSGVDPDVQLWQSRGVGAAVVIPFVATGSYRSVCDDARNPPAGTTANNCAWYTRPTTSGSSMLSDGLNGIGFGFRPLVTTPIQGDTIFNQQVTSGVNAAVAVTITGVAGRKNHLSRLYARCSAGTSNITVTDGVTTVYTTQAAEVTTTNFERSWAPALTSISLGTNLVVTLAACGAGNTGILGVQADQF